ncbi:MAG: DUF294 nucleotidyltransferase-like domain-containing protein, partial [Gammaproteobacteria bacterium]
MDENTVTKTDIEATTSKENMTAAETYRKTSKTSTVVEPSALARGAFASHEVARCTVSGVLQGLGFETVKAQIGLLRVLLLRRIADEALIANLKPQGSQQQSWLDTHKAGYAYYSKSLTIVKRLQQRSHTDAYLAADKSFEPLLACEVSVAGFRRWLLHGLQLRCLRQTFHREIPGSDTLQRWCETGQPVGRRADGVSALIEQDIIAPLGLLCGISWPQLPANPAVPVGLIIHGGLEDTVGRRIQYLSHLVSYRERLGEGAAPWPVFYPSNPRGLFAHEPSVAVLLGTWFARTYDTTYAARWGSQLAIEERIRTVLQSADYEKTPWYEAEALLRLKTAIKRALGLGEADPWPTGGYVRQLRTQGGSAWQAFERAGHGHLVDWPSAFDMVERHLDALMATQPALSGRLVLHSLPLYVENNTGKHALANTEDSLLAVYAELQEEGIGHVIAVSDNEGHQTRYQQAQTEGVLGRAGIVVSTVSPGALTWRLDTALDNLAKTVYVQQAYGPAAYISPEHRREHRARRHTVYSPRTGHGLEWPADTVTDNINTLPSLPGPQAVAAGLHSRIRCAHNAPFYGALLATYWSLYPDRDAMAALSEHWYGHRGALDALWGYTGSGSNPLATQRIQKDLPTTVEGISRSLARPLWVWKAGEGVRFVRQARGANHSLSQCPIMLAEEADGGWWLWMKATQVPAFVASDAHRYIPLLTPVLPMTAAIKPEGIPSRRAYPTLAAAQEALAAAEVALTEGDKEAACQQYALALKQSNERALVDRSSGKAADKENRWLQIASVLGLAAYYGEGLVDNEKRDDGKSVARANPLLTVHQARVYTWVWGLYRYGLAIVDATLESSSMLSLSPQEKSTLNRWKVDLLSYSHAYFVSLMSPDTAAERLSHWCAVVKRQQGYRKALDQLRKDTGDALATLNKCRPWLVPTTEAEAFQGVTRATLREEGQTYAEAVEGVYDVIRQGMVALTGKVFEDAVNDVGPAPCGYSLVGLGSLGRGDMTPYSDLECVLLIEKDTPPIRDYFRRVSAVFQGWVIQLQETILPTLVISVLNHEHGQEGDFYDHGLYIKRGWSLDGSMSHASKTPLGRLGTDKKPWCVELIQTPAVMVGYSHYWSDVYEGHHLADMLHTTVPIIANAAGAALYSQFTDAVSTQTRAQSDELASLRQRRALRTLQEDMLTFDPRIQFNKEDGTPVEIKKGLYRLPTLLIQGLAVLAGCASHCTGLAELDYLQSEGIVSESTYPLLRLWLTLAKVARLQIYLGHGAQQERQGFVGKSPFDRSSLVSRRVTQGKDPVSVGLMVCWYQVALPVYGTVNDAIFLDRLLPGSRFHVSIGDNISARPRLLDWLDLTTLESSFTAAPAMLTKICRRLWLLDTALYWVERWLQALKCEQHAQ